MSADVTKRPRSSTAWAMWFFASLFYLYQFILRGSPNVMADKLIEDFAIHASSFGFLTACYYYCYACLQIPVGLLLDRFGPKVILRIAVLLCLAGAFIFATAPTLAWAGLGRALIGCGAASGFLGTACISKHWFPPQKLALVLGLTTAFGTFGGMASNLPLAVLLNHMTWRQTMFILVGLGVGVAVIVWLFIQNMPQQYAHPQAADSQAPPPQDVTASTVGYRHIKGPLKHILKNKSIWLIGVYGALMYLPLTVFTDVWGTSFLIRGLGMDRETAALGVSFVLVGCAVGSPLVGMVSERVASRKKPMVVSALVTAAAASILVLVPGLSAPMVFGVLFAMGLGMTGQTLVFVAGSEAVPRDMHGLVSGFINMVVMMGGVIFQPLTGMLIDWVWSGGVDVNNLPVYKGWDYRIALCVLPTSALISVILGLFIRETHPEKVHSDGKPI